MADKEITKEKVIENIKDLDIIIENLENQFKYLDIHCQKTLEAICATADNSKVIFTEEERKAVYDPLIKAMFARASRITKAYELYLRG